MPVPHLAPAGCPGNTGGTPVPHRERNVAVPHQEASFVMFIGKVTGTVVASQKVRSVIGKKLLLVQSMTVEGMPPGALKPSGRVAVAVDTVGAGEGELVLVTQGSSARLTEMTSDVPTDAVIIGIIDAIQVGEKELYKQRG